MKTKEILQVIATLFLIVAGSYISVPIGPVPVVLTNFFIIVTALIIGPKKALIAMAIYIILGALSLPVFSNGRGGINHLLGLTGGFIFGFIPLALLSGLGRNKGIVFKILLTLAGSILVYLIGVPWAIYVYNTSINPETPWTISKALSIVMTPFIIPDLIKIGVAIGIERVVSPVVRGYISGDE